jgi:hypothetical protein
MRCSNMTTYNMGAINNIHDKRQHANSNHLTTACYKKIYDEAMYTQWHKKFIHYDKFYM